MKVARQMNTECEGFELYPAVYFQWLEEAIATENLDYKQYALLGFLYDNSGFQKYVQGRERPQVYEDFMKILRINMNNYLSGLKSDGQQFSKSAQIRDRHIYYITHFMRQLASNL